MFDLPYILTHPLLRAIYQRCAELEEEARAMPEGSAQRKELERRIARLEEYRLPKPDARDLEQSEPIFNRWGQKIGERHSIRRRFKESRRGRSAEYRLRTRAALEEKLANPKLRWAQLAEKYALDAETLKRAVRLLKVVLRREGIPLPPQSAYSPPAPAPNVVDEFPDDFDLSAFWREGEE